MIKDISVKELMARKFKTKEKCNRNYTRILYEKKKYKKIKFMVKLIVVVL